jgi:hypothetical protein
MSLGTACFIDEAFYGKKQNLWSWDYFPQVLDYQDFWIVGLWIEGNLQYIQN